MSDCAWLIFISRSRAAAIWSSQAAASCHTLGARAGVMLYIFLFKQQFLKLIMMQKSTFGHQRSMHGELTPYGGAERAWPQRPPARCHKCSRTLRGSH